jgi:molybdenum cofactor guanylyltransferase
VSERPHSGYDAIILAGGAARRMGGADKPATEVGGRALVAWVIDAVADAGRVVVVGPDRPELTRPGAAPGSGRRPRLTVVREDPPGAGPVPALAAGLAGVRAPVVALLAADLPFLRAVHLTELRRRLDGRAGAVLVDDSGHSQWLAGVWRTEALAAALAGYRGASLRGLLAPLDPRRVMASADAHPPWYDCDTPDELADARRRLAATTGRPDGAGGQARGWECRSDRRERGGSGSRA